MDGCIEEGFARLLELYNSALHTGVPSLYLLLVLLPKMALVQLPCPDDGLVDLEIGYHFRERLEPLEVVGFPCACIVAVQVLSQRFTFALRARLACSLLHRLG